MKMLLFLIAPLLLPCGLALDCKEFLGTTVWDPPGSHAAAPFPVIHVNINTRLSNIFSTKDNVTAIYHTVMSWRADDRIAEEARKHGCDGKYAIRRDIQHSLWIPPVFVSNAVSDKILRSSVYFNMGYMKLRQHRISQLALRSNGNATRIEPIFQYFDDGALESLVVEQFVLPVMHYALETNWRHTYDL